MSLHIQYRPASLDDVYGNEVAVTTLKGFLKKKNLPHTLMFMGTTGCGKTTLARIVANEVNCEEEDIYEMNASKERGIDAVRRILATCAYPSLSASGIKVIIVDEAHKLTDDAQNAFLKSAEDTPEYVYFMFCTTRPQKLIKEIRNRCSIFEVKPLKKELMDSLIKEILDGEGVTLKQQIVDAIINSSDGVPREALQKLNQILAVPPKKRMIIAKRSIKEHEEGFALSKALIYKRASWQEIAKILRGLNPQEAETIRRNVLAVAASVLLKGKEDDNAGLVLECFNEPFYDSGFPALVGASYLVFKG